MGRPDAVDLGAGIMFFGMGCATLILSFNYRMGTAAEMGAGYFPMLLGCVLMAFGSAIIVSSFFERTKHPPVTQTYRGLAFIIGSVVLFAAALDLLGVVVTTFFVTISSSLASPSFSLKRASLTGVALAAACYAIFVLGLRLPMQVWPTI